MRILFILVVALLSTAYAQSCTIGKNCFANGTVVQYAVDMYWNPTCANEPLTPYCTQTKTVTQCSYCNPQRTVDGAFWSICDCQANQFCDPDIQSSTYATCIPFPLSGASCASYANCPILAYSPNGGSMTVGYWSCLNGYCKACNQTGVYGTETWYCPAGSPYSLSSRPGETRTCSPIGVWIGGGAINVQSSSTTNNSTSSGAPRNGGAGMLSLLAASLFFVSTTTFVSR